MRVSDRLGLGGAILAAAAVLAAAPVPPVYSPGQSNSVRAITHPSGDVTLSFVKQGTVDKIRVKEGDSVAAGQLVAELDNKEELVQLESDQAVADDHTETEIDRKVLEKDKLDYETILKNASATEFEKSDARLKVEIDDARITGQLEKEKQSALKVKATKALLEKLKLATPISGVVAQAMVHEGETVDAGNMKVMRVVQVDPLWIEAPVPIAQARQLKAGDIAQVTFTDKMTRPGKVSLVFPVGDSASGTINVRIEVPNPQKLQAGENVNVVFPSQMAAKPN